MAICYTLKTVNDAVLFDHAYLKYLCTFLAIELALQAQ